MKSLLVASQRNQWRHLFTTSNPCKLLSPWRIQTHSLAIEQIETYDDARQSGLIFEREHESLSGTGTLASTQHFGHAYATAIARRREITAAQHATQGPLATPLRVLAVIAWGEALGRKP